MSTFAINFNEPPWPELEEAKHPILHTIDGGTMLVNGMKSGKSAVVLRMTTAMDEVILGQMSLAMLESFVKACRAREEYLEGLMDIPGGGL